MMAVLGKAEQISAQSVQIMILGFGVSTIVDRPVYGSCGWVVAWPSSAVFAGDFLDRGRS